MRLLLILAVLAQAGLIEPAGSRDKSDKSGKSGKSGKIRREESPRPQTTPAPAPRPSTSGGRLIVPRDPSAPAPRPFRGGPRSWWRRHGGYWYDPHDHYWYSHHQGHWWRHDPIHQTWIIYQDAPRSGEPGYPEPQQATRGGSWRSPDGRRLVEIMPNAEAYLYDSSVSPARLLKRLAGEVSTARFSDGFILLDMLDGSFRLFDEDGDPAKPPTGKPPASP